MATAPADGGGRTATSRLDIGPDEPGGVLLSSGVQDPPSGPVLAPVAAPSPTRRPGWTPGRVLSVVAGALALVLSFGLLTGGGALLVADTAWRDARGFVTTVDRPLSSAGYAVSVTSVVLEASPGQAELPGRVVGDVRIRVTATDPSRSVFVGIAPSSDLQAYLGTVSRSVPSSTWRRATDVPGTAPSAPPGSLDIWAAHATGSGTQELVWTPRTGDWGVAVMNADASAGVAVTASVGAQLPWLGPVGVVLLVMGVMLLGGGVLLVVLGAHRARSPR
jgi:hypothetical protein